MKTKGEIIQAALEKQPTLTRAIVNKLARKYGYGEEGLWNYYLENYNELTNQESNIYGKTSFGN
jgi:hypothetical protein